MPNRNPTPTPNPKPILGTSWVIIWQGSEFSTTPYTQEKSDGTLQIKIYAYWCIPAHFKHWWYSKRVNLVIFLLSLIFHYMLTNSHYSISTVSLGLVE